MTLASVTPLEAADRAAAEAQVFVLVDKLGDPHVADSLNSLLDHAELLALLVQSLDDFLNRSEEVGNSIIGLFGEARTTVTSNDALKGAKGVDLATLSSMAMEVTGLLPQVADMLPQLTQLATPALVEQLSVLTRGLEAGATAYQTEDRMQVNGLMSAMRLFKDPDVCTAVSFFATVLRAIGREVAK